MGSRKENLYFDIVGLKGILFESENVKSYIATIKLFCSTYFQWCCFIVTLFKVGLTFNSMDSINS